jgi:light-regulated signal transduction histidine kinase (bacteriophytochrome)
LVGALRLLTIDNQGQQQALDELNAILNAGRDGRDPSGQRNLGPRSSSEGPRQPLQAIIVAMKGEEQRLLAERLEIAKKSAARIKTIILIGNVLALVFLLASALAIQHEMGKRSTAQAQLSQSEEVLRLRNAQLEASNKELESFSYSVSHDLRAPLRAIDGFSLAILEDYAAKFDEEGKRQLHRIRAAVSRMGNLIDDMLKLARIARSEIVHNRVNLTKLAEEVISDLRVAAPEREVSISIAPDLTVSGDRNLLRIVLQNLLGNAWKFTAARANASIAFGRTTSGDEVAFFVQDNGAGFDMQYANKLFGVFQRLHSDSTYPGNGVGLATVNRIIMRHGGRIWADAKPGQGATFYFVL